MNLNLNLNLNPNPNPNLLHDHHHVYFNYRIPRMINHRTASSNDWCVGMGHGLSALMRRKSSSSSSRVSREIPSRDRVIDFGKYKGKMLGTVPSKYLKWVSKNLRAGDFEEWAKLADQVLEDPIYRDRIEWEFALNVLNGDSSSLRRPASESAVSELLEISERFGWDNLDKSGWAKVDFDLLGTSKGGRIPRRINLNLDRNHSPPASLALFDSVSPQPKKTRRMERRERQKMRLRIEAEAQRHNKDMVMANDDDTLHCSIGKQDDERGQILNQNAILSPFPGRQALMQKVLNHKGRFVS